MQWWHNQRTPSLIDGGCKVKNERQLSKSRRAAMRNKKAEQENGRQMSVVEFDGEERTMMLDGYIAPT